MSGQNAFCPGNFGKGRDVFGNKSAWDKQLWQQFRQATWAVGTGPEGYSVGSGGAGQCEGETENQELWPLDCM